MSFAVARSIAHYAPADSLGLPTLIWWVGVSLIAMATLVLVDRFARRFLPLATLLKLSLVFPDQAPSRFKRSLRTGTTNQLAKELNHFRTHGQLTDDTTYGDYLLELANAITKHDRLTRGHSERVRAYSDLIAEELGLPQEDRDKLHWAALLHDVGKLDVPSSILNKAGKPNEYEWMVLKGHPGAARVYLEPLRPWLGEWLHAADEHHLRWDGNGYPAKTAGTDISLAGRIVAVADAYDVMTSARSYKKAMPPADARAEIANCAGSQFDPAIARAFLNIGLSKLKLSAGPISWLGHTFGLETAGVSVVAAPAATTASVATQAAVAAMTIAGSVGPALTGSPTPSEPLAFVDNAVVSTTAAETTTAVPFFEIEEPETTVAPSIAVVTAPPTTLEVIIGETTTTVQGPDTTTSIAVTTTTLTTTTTAAPTTTTTTEAGPTGEPPEFDMDNELVGFGGVETSIEINVDDPDEDLVSLEVDGLPVGLELIGYKLTGTIANDALDQVHDLVFTATDAGGNRTELMVPLRAVQFDVSPLNDTIFISEVLFKGGPTVEFVELASKETIPIDISGYTLWSGNPHVGNGAPLLLEIPDGTVIDENGPRERAVLWFGSKDRRRVDASEHEWERPNIPKLDDSADDLFLLDADGRLVAYVAWGQGTTVSPPPTIEEGDFWNDSHQWLLPTTERGQSISMASQWGGSTGRSVCWELTGSGDSKAKGCPGARVTVDTDNSHPERRTNVSRREY